MAGLSAGASCFQPDHSRPASLESLASGQPQCGPSPIVAIIVATAAGLLVVSTRVGGVPEVLPADMLLLAEPSPEGLVGAVGAALLRVGAGGADPWEQHAAVRSMYSWQSIAQRPERVYRGVLLEARHDSSAGGSSGMVARLRRYHKCGKWFGKICCCITGALAWGGGQPVLLGSLRVAAAIQRSAAVHGQPANDVNTLALMPMRCHFHSVMQRWTGCTGDSWSGGSLPTAWKQRPTSRPPRQQLAAGACAI